MGSSPYSKQDDVEHSDLDESLDQTEPSDVITMPDDVAEPASSKQIPEVKAFSCHKCTYMTGVKHNLHRHIRSVHREKDAIICTECGKPFKSEDALSEHKAKHKKDFFCEECGKIFHSKKGLRLHKMSTHEAPGMKYKCFICSKSFYEKAHFTGHLNAHNNSEPYECSKCRKSFSYKSNLLRHQKTCIREEKDNKNRSCNASSSSSVTLKKHSTGTQSETKLYRCVCGQFFKWRSTLGTHRKKCILWKVKDAPCS